MYPKHLTRFVASLLVCASVGAWATAGRADPPSAPAATWRRPVGPVRLALTALLVAPGKSNGDPWDGPLPLPEPTRVALHEGLAPSAFRAVFAAFADGAGAGAAARFAPWATNSLIRAGSAPDIRADVLVDGRPVSRLRTQTHTTSPSWPLAQNPSVQIGPNQQIDVDVWDVDLVRDDRIGVCTIQGMPLVDRNSYARAQDFTCNGQVWGVRLRVLADSYESASTAEAPAAPPPSAAPPPAGTDPAPAPPSAPPPATPEARRGGAGESCTRTDDCSSPLRCIRHECTTPPP